MNLRSFQVRFATLLGCFLHLSASVFADGVIYVDANATGPVFDGSSWCSAYRQLYEALPLATAGTTIRVADGVYKPDPTGLADPRTATMTLIGGVILEGGYAGCGAADPDKRNIGLYRPTISCDLAGDDQPAFVNRADNCLTALTLSSNAVQSTVDGFAFTGSGRNAVRAISASIFVRNCEFIENGDSPSGPFLPAYYGGAIYNSGRSTRIENSTFRRNRSRGGAIYNRPRLLEIVGCSFVENEATISEGGAVYSEEGSLFVSGCSFHGNFAMVQGGAISVRQVDADTFHCEHSVFEGNVSKDTGGAVSFASRHVFLDDCLFRANSAVEKGAAIHAPVSELRIRDCSIVDNVARYPFGAGVYNSGGNITEISNSIIWGNGPPGQYGDGTWSSQIAINTAKQSLVTDCCIMDWYVDPSFPPPSFTAVAISASDPLFTPGPSGCYYLSQIAAGQNLDSPYIDAGSASAIDLGLADRTTRTDETTDTGIVDIGYHYPVTGRPFIRGDADYDGRVDLADIAGFQNCFTGVGPAFVPPCCRLFEFVDPAQVGIEDWAAIEAILDNP